MSKYDFDHINNFDHVKIRKSLYARKGFRLELYVNGCCDSYCGTINRTGNFFMTYDFTYNIGVLVRYNYNDDDNDFIFLRGKSFRQRPTKRCYISDNIHRSFSPVLMNDGDAVELDFSITIEETKEGDMVYYEHKVPPLIV